MRIGEYNAGRIKVAPILMMNFCSGYSEGYEELCCTGATMDDSFNIYGGVGCDKGEQVFQAWI